MRFDLERADDDGADDASVLAAVVSRAHAVSARRSAPLIVAVDGPSGSGKTTLAEALAERLPATLVRMDDLYPGWDGLAQAVELVTDLVLEPLSCGERAAYRRWDWARGTWGETLVAAPSPFLVLEGCGSSVLPAGRYAAVRVWVQADREVRMRRGMERDGESFRPHWERWAGQEDALFAADRTRERADFVVDTTPAG